VRAALVLVLLGLGVATAGPAWASEALSDTNVQDVKLAVNGKGEALVTYVRSNGAPRRVLAWGAVNALPTSSGRPQTRFRWDYAGGWRSHHDSGYWRTFRNACRPYDGPPVVYAIATCKAPNGSYWALQSWQRRLPLLGFAPWLPTQTAFEVHLSHWSGELPTLSVGVHWTYEGSAIGIFGRLSYAGEPVYGLSATNVGNPHDRYGRNVYIDTFDSAYGKGWARESGILVHRGTGTFCHSFVPQKPFPNYPDQQIRPAAPGERYRVTVMGPGVTPVVQWEGAGLAAWDQTQQQRETQASALELWDAVMTGDKQCAGERA